MRGKYKRRRINRATLRGRHYARIKDITLNDPDIVSHLEHHPTPDYKEHFTKGFVLERMGVPDHIREQEARHNLKNSIFAAQYGGTVTGRIASGKTRLSAQIALNNEFNTGPIIDSLTAINKAIKNLTKQWRP